MHRTAGRTGSKGDKTIRWGVLGAAAIATGRTMPAMRLAPSATLLALASRDPVKGSKVAQEHGIARVHTSYEALLADADIDAVYVPLPNQLHFEWALRPQRLPHRRRLRLPQPPAMGQARRTDRWRRHR
jgi:hypothetical protein